jgi:hypothetical protein
MLSKHAFKNLVKRCIAEAIVEGDTVSPFSVYVKTGPLAGKYVVASKKKDGIYYRFNMDTGTDEPIGDERSVSISGPPPKIDFHQQMKDLGASNKMMDKMGLGGIDEKIHSASFKSLVKECILEVLKENLSEGFDPTSMGPNPVEENPYPAWNARMRNLEEEETDEANVDEKFGRYAQEAGADEFDPRTFGVNEKSDSTCMCKTPKPCAKDRDTMYCGNCMKGFSHKQKKKHFSNSYIPHVGDIGK